MFRRNKISFFVLYNGYINKLERFICLYLIR